MQILTQDGDKLGIEAYLKACGGPLFMSHAGRDLMVSYEPLRGYMAWTMETETHPDDTGNDDLVIALNNPIDRHKSPPAVLTIKLVKTLQHGDQFAQNWLITAPDGTTHQVDSDSKWGNINIDVGADKIYEVPVTGGTVSVRAWQIVACEISCTCNCVEDGNEIAIDEKWIKSAESFGIQRETLIRPYG